MPDCVYVLANWDDNKISVVSHLENTECICFQFLNRYIITKKTLSDVRTSAEYKELQTKYARQSDELDNHVKNLADLKQEKFDLAEGKDMV